MSNIRINARFEIPAEQLQWSFARSSGPGGQNVNKVNSKATLRWKPVVDEIPMVVWTRFAKLARRYLTNDGEIVIQSQEHRDQPQNVQACREKLRELLIAAWNPPKPRVATKPTRSSQRRRLDDKKKRSEKKRGRQIKDF